MLKLFKSVVDLAEDVVTVGTAPVRVVADLADIAVKPVASAADAVADEVSEVKEDLG